MDLAKEVQRINKAWLEANGITPAKTKVQEFMALGIDEDCDECPHLCEEKDPFNTGDSPTEYSCEGSADECQRLEIPVKMGSLNDFISEHE